jgi:hypothetical protein
MTTYPKNNNVEEAFFTRQYPNLGGNSINQGDYVYVNQTSFDLNALDSDAHAQYLAGVSNDTWPIGAYPTSSQVGPSIGGGPTYPLEGMNVTRHGRVTRYTVNGNIYFPAQRVYFSTDAQHVTNAQATNSLGTVANLPDGSQNGLVGTGTNTIQVDLPETMPQ